MRYLQCLQRNRGQSIESVWDNLAYGTEFQHAADEANKDANTVRENLVRIQLQIQLMMKIKSISKIKTEAPLTKCDKQWTQLCKFNCRFRLKSYFSACAQKVEAEYKKKEMFVFPLLWLNVTWSVGVCMWLGGGAFQRNTSVQFSREMELLLCILRKQWVALKPASLKLPAMSLKFIYLFIY